MIPACLQYHDSIFQAKLLIILLAILLATVFLGCGRDSEKTGDSQTKSGKKPLSHIYEKLGPYQGWEKQRFERVVFVYPPDHLNSKELADYAKIFSALTRKTASFLQIVPPDSLTIYFYPNAKHGITVTGFFAPFAEGEVIHFWLPGKVGQPIAQLLISSWSKKETNFEFLKQGIITLLDGFGENYHIRTINYLNSGKFLPLEKLAADTTVDADRERYQSAMAASFVDYIVYEYGIVYFKELYESDSNFSSAVQSIYKLQVDSLEKNWMKVVEKIVSKAQETAE